MYTNEQLKQLPKLEYKIAILSQDMDDADICESLDISSRRLMILRLSIQWLIDNPLPSREEMMAENRGAEIVHTNSKYL